MRNFRFILAGVTSLFLAAPRGVLACAACFGKSDDAMAHGMNMGIFTLLIVIVSVLAGIFAIGVYFVRRSARLAAGQLAEPPPATGRLSQSISQPTP